MFVMPTLGYSLGLGNSVGGQAAHAMCMGINTDLSSPLWFLVVPNGLTVMHALVRANVLDVSPFHTQSPLQVLQLLHR